MPHESDKELETRKAQKNDGFTQGPGATTDHCTVVEGAGRRTVPFVALRCESHHTTINVRNFVSDLSIFRSDFDHGDRPTGHCVLPADRPLYCL